MANLLLIDEATMLDRFQLESLDRTLRDLMGQPKLPFGGKVLVLAGDFRQCLPVVPGATRAETVSHCLNQSHLWKYFQIVRLSENMRVKASGNPILEVFDQGTLSIGNGEASNGSVSIPNEMVTEIIPNSPSEPWHEANSMKKFCQIIYSNIESNINNPKWLEGRSILTAINKEVDAINEMMQNWLI